MRRIHASLSTTPIKHSGCWHFQGPQPVDSVPWWVVEAFQKHPDIKHITIDRYEDKGPNVVYTRMEEE